MGYALARQGLRRGADVTLISGPTSLSPPTRVRLISVKTAAEMRKAVLKEFPNATTVLMAAAVADYHPERMIPRKIKREKGPVQISLKPNPDILKEIGTKKDGKILVGFAAETDTLVDNAKKKLREKNLDLIVANDVTKQGSGFDSDTNIATLLDRDGHVRSLPLMAKDELANHIYDYLLVLRSKKK